MGGVNQPSGKAWVKRYPTSVLISDLASPFRESVEDFVAALRKAGARVLIAATKRPKERAYLMHWAWRIAREQFDPAKVPAMLGVPILWEHEKQMTAAKEMVAAYGLVHRAALTSRHIEGRAIDMSITWDGVLELGGREIGEPRNGADNKVLHEIADLEFSVKKLAKDPPHWSDDGR